MKKKMRNTSNIKKQNNIEIKGARVNNLRNFDVAIPRRSLTVVTGVSGSGKSSLAFDTLYAEGQRRYVESLSAYARQFLGRMAKPECDWIKGLPPAIAIEQRVNTRNPRSTVGTSTEIYDYLRMLFARVGRTYSPVSGCEVKHHTAADAVRYALSFPEGTRMAVLSDIVLPENRSFEDQLRIFLKEGFSRLEHDGAFVDIAELIESEKPAAPEYYRLLIDRLSVSDEKDEVSRLTDSIETAMFEGRGRCTIKVWGENEIEEQEFSNKFEADGIEFIEPSDLMFNFNNPYGACPTCEGFGKILGVSEELVVPDRTKSIYQDAVVCWRGEKMSEWKNELVRMSASLNFPIHTPYVDLTREEIDTLWHGRDSWLGIDGFFRWLDTRQDKIQFRVMKARFRGKTICPDCRGSRLRKDALYVKVGGRTISYLTDMPVTDLIEWFSALKLDATESKIAERMLYEIRSRLEFLKDVGLGYLTLSRPSNTLSGGESQRINLATSLGSSLVGSLYILDEPSIGLHPRDTDRLISILRKLRDSGNTVVVVEHDEEIMRAADYLIDIGPDAGRLGGELVFAGDAQKAMTVNPDKSHTLQYLQGKVEIQVPDLRRPWHQYIEVKGARANNLKDIDVKFPLGVLTVVTGVSGSGKSTLVREILYKAMLRYLGEGTDAPGTHKGLAGSPGAIKNVEFIDQNAIGTSSRSNPATYLKAYDELRKLFAEQPLARQINFTPGYFSFNSEGGRCEECKGEGTISIPMQFMADITVECEVCHGHRFKQEVLDVLYRGKSIYDMLEMTVSEAIAFLKEEPTTQSLRVVKRLQPLADVGLGYVKLGQSSSTLSGGESQRVKLAHFLSHDQQDPTLFIFDEPTTGLHFADISTLMKSLQRLVERGHTVIIIEHNMEIIKCADYIIDIGPDGGDAGGRVVASGTPEEVASNPDSLTGKYLKGKMSPRS